MVRAWMHAWMLVGALSLTVACGDDGNDNDAADAGDEATDTGSGQPTDTETDEPTDTETDTGGGTDDVDTGMESVSLSTSAEKESLVDLAYNSANDEFLAVWCLAPASSQSEMVHRVLAQRVSTDGALVGDQIVLSEGAGIRTVARAVFNPNGNEYMIMWSEQRAKMDVVIGVYDDELTEIVPPAAVSSEAADQVHITLAYNTKDDEVLITYNDSRAGEGNGNVYGLILDSRAQVVKDEFAINDSQGNLFNPVVAYNPAENNYLLNWEDFRFESAWMDPGNIVGAIVDADGTVLVNDILMVEDHDAADEGDQRFNFIAYNAVDNAFLTSWGDTRPSWQNASVAGRFVAADGSMSASDFALIDDAGAQMIAHPVYAEGENRYFVVWENDTNDLDDLYFMDMNAELDVYAQWVEADGTRIGEPMIIAATEPNERFVKATYSPASRVVLVAWQEDVGEATDPIGHMTATGGDIRSVIIPLP